MARYELGAIYKIDGGEKSYYARLLTSDVYGVFEPVLGEICQATFENTPYRLYISTGSFAVKRGFWEKVIPSPDKTDAERWSGPSHLIGFAPWDIESSLERRNSFDRHGCTEILNREEYITYLKLGYMSNILPMKIFRNFSTYIMKIGRKAIFTAPSWAALTNTKKNKSQF